MPNPAMEHFRSCCRSWLDSWLQGSIAHTGIDSGYGPALVVLLRRPKLAVVVTNGASMIYRKEVDSRHAGRKLITRLERTEVSHKTLQAAGWERLN